MTVLYKPVHLLLAFSLLISFSAHAASLPDITQLYKKGKTEQALAELDQYLASLPKDSWGRNVTQARFLRGRILAETKHTDEAIRVFTKLTLDYPSLPEPYNNLAALYVSQGKYDAARDTLERALLIDPSYATLHANLNDLYAKLSTQAYESTLHGTTGTPAPERIRALCDNYGKMAGQAAGSRMAPRADADYRMIQDIPASRAAAAQPPAHVDVDEMAIESPASPHPDNTRQAADKAATQDPTPNKVVATTDPVKAPLADTDTADKAAILKALQGWSNAWSGKNVNVYLAFYASDFRIPNGGTRSAWATQRRERISKPRTIHVAIESPQVKQMDATHAQVGFKQTYRSDALQTTGRKTLVMIKSNGKWLIQEERVGG